MTCGCRMWGRLHDHPDTNVQVQFSLISIGPQQRDIQDVCKALGIGLIAYSPLGLGMLTGKYDVSSGRLPKGPRGLLFRQILPGLEPLLGTMNAIAKERRKSVSQVRLLPELRPPQSEQRFVLDERWQGLHCVPQPFV